MGFIFATASFVCTLTWIGVILEALRTGVLWGLAAIFIPFAYVFFVALHWEENRTMFTVHLISGAVALAIYAGGAG